MIAHQSDIMDLSDWMQVLIGQINKHLPPLDHKLRVVNLVACLRPVWHKNMVIRDQDDVFRPRLTIDGRKKTERPHSRLSSIGSTRSKLLIRDRDTPDQR